MKRAGIIELDEQKLAQLLKLPAGVTIASVNADWDRMCVRIMILGESLPDVALGAEPPTLEGDFELVWRMK